MRRPREPRGPVTLENIADELDKLVRHVASLDANVARLADRIEPAEGEPPFKSRPMRRRRPAEITLRHIWDVLADADDQLQGAELDIGRIRSVINQIDDDIVSREDMKQWIGKPEKRR